MQENLLNKSIDYVFASPRYNLFRNQTTNLIPEDYGYYDNINGSYDKYFPCYSLDTNDIPLLKLKNAENIDTSLKTSGDISLSLFKTKYPGKQVGKVDKPDSPSNSNLEQKKIYFTTYIASKLNPGWSVIQSRAVKDSNTNKYTYTPNFIIRALGTNEVCDQIFAIDIDDKTMTSGILNYKTGTIVKQKESENNTESRYYLWKALSDTTSRPPRKPTELNPNWKLLDFTFNVFNADIFSIANKEINYFMDVSNKTRKFHPNKENDSLVCWNMSYYFNG